MIDRDRRRLGLQVLLAVIRDRELMARLTPAQWDALIQAADGARLLPRLAADVERLGLTTAQTDWMRDRLTSERIRGREFERAVLWEIDRIHRTLKPIGVRPVFLKGAAYIAGGLPCGIGRVVADVDILVPEAEVPRVQAALEQHGWAFEPLDRYDERYYREWMHELPPMRHQARGTMLDVHHRILPKTGRIHPPTERLLQHAVDVGGTRMLSPEHMVLHSAAHLFQDGEVAGALREVVDLHDLLATFGERSGFWGALAAQARTLGLGRPLFYAVRYARLTTGISVPEDTLLAIGRWRPPGAVLQLMDSLVGAAFWRSAHALATPAALALYVRSHWLKMPVGLLVRHMAHKVIAK